MKKINEFAGASQAYEAPEIETIEVRMENNIMSGDCSSDVVCSLDDNPGQGEID